MAEQVEEYIDLLYSHEGVCGVLILNSDGLPIKSTMDFTTSLDYAGLLDSVVAKSKRVLRYIDPLDTFKGFRLRTKKSEIMLFADGEFTIILEQYLFN